jgi:anti-sigma B factor antagonist
MVLCGYSVDCLSENPYDFSIFWANVRIPMKCGPQAIKIWRDGQDMRMSSKSKDDIMILEVNGRVVGDASLEMRRSINGWLAEIPEGQKPKVILDLSKVSMMDSSGLGVLVSSYTSVQKRNGRLVLAGLGKGLQNLIAITKLTRVFDIYENAEEALKSFQE